MSNTTNHKNAIAITASCRLNKGRLTDIYYKILEDQPSSIINAWKSLQSPPGYKGRMSADQCLVPCQDCHKLVDAVGIAGSCIACDPRGFDGL